MQNIDLKRKMDNQKKRIFQQKEKEGIPEYGAGGRMIRQKKKIPKALLITVGVLLVLVCILYLPELFYSLGDKDTGKGTYFTTPDVVALRNYTEYSRDYPQEDFDGDGLTNEQEEQYGTSPRRVDTDGDGVTDYAELFVYETNPLKQDSGLYNAFLVEDAENGGTATSPYRIGNVILWADNYNYKAYGCVIETLNGYRFTNFQGWAEFPEGNYAYQIVDGKHVLLGKREAENAWRIENSNEVVLYDEPLDMVNELKIVGLGSFYLEDDFWGNLLSAILPDHAGPITCDTKARIDTWVDARDEVTAPIEKIKYDTSDLSRYGRNQNRLTDLAQVYQILQDGDSVLVALNSVYDGEIIAEVYGYDADGNLLIANADTLKPVGTLSIEPKAKKIMDENGNFSQLEYFDFYGLGFDSRVQSDTIAFLAAAVDSSEKKSEQETGNQESSASGTENSEIHEDNMTSGLESAFEGMVQPSN